MSPITRHASGSLAGLVVHACNAAIKDAGMRPVDVDGAATFPTAAFHGTAESEQEGLHTIGVSYLIDHLPGLSNVRWFSESSVGLVVSAIIDSVNAIATGSCSVAIVWRAMSRPTRRDPMELSGRPRGEDQYFVPYNVAPGVIAHALAYRRYQWQYGARREDMATLAVNSRRNAAMNNLAVFRDRDLSVDEYMSARLISSPLCLYDCDVPVFGAAAIVLTAAARAKDCPNAPAYVLGIGQQSSKQPRVGRSLNPLLDYMTLGGRMAKSVWESSGLGPKDVDVAQLYDGFSPSVLYWLEAAGFCSRGEGYEFIQDGRIALDGELPVNTFGGSLSEGRMHGMGHVIEAVRQVTGRAGPRQVPGADVSVAFDGSPMIRGAALALAGRRE
jgi:acetyl-CoA acetyltransferase